MFKNRPLHSHSQN